MLDQITPLILTYNEQDNIARTLAKLTWARDIVVVDSFSTDETVKKAKQFGQVRIFQRVFDMHAVQWNFGLTETGITTDWVLALDADYLLSDLLIKELQELKPNSKTTGFRVNFRYCVFGKPLRGSLYPSVTVLYRRDLAEYVQDGHTQRVVVNGDVKPLMGNIYHDDRKPLFRWLLAQDKYMRIEAETIRQSAWKDLGSADRLRKLVVFAPFVVFFYCLLIKQVALDGKSGLYYALQRMVAEIILSLRLIEEQLYNRK